MAHLRRGDVVQHVPAAVELGDIVTVAAGDRVPADARLVESRAPAVDEAPLTRESSSELLWRGHGLLQRRQAERRHRVLRLPSARCDPCGGIIPSRWR
ncbi:hypothetical protein [Microbispora triticiradicis]|uniref:P-type ATPase n=1 Tax=Microbispora triticiradicis TaxID=2200763 RepID=UPI001AD7C8F4|nr:hypothetical protein [Microbispora triticiradicis]MBO4269569.1 hypothetical protein [Microbispora triticiradicis]